MNFAVMHNSGYIVDDLEFEKRQDKNDTKSMERQYTYEEAVELVETGRFHYALLLICGVCFMSVMVEILGVGLIMTPMKCDLTVTLTEQGILASAGFFGVVMSSHAMGFLADTWGRVKTLRYALIFSFIATIFSVFSVSIWMLIIFRFLNGFFISGCQACVFSYVGEFHSNKTRVFHVTLLSIFLPLGVIYLPAVAMMVIPLKIVAPVFDIINFSSWRVVLLCNSILSLIALCGLLMLPESPKYVLVQGRHDEALEILQKTYSMNTGKPKDSYPVKSIILEPTGVNLSGIHGVCDALKLIWSQTVPMFSKERVFYTITISLVQFSIYGISQGVFMWSPIIVNELVAKADSGLSVCQIVTSMDVSSDSTEQSIDKCSGEVDIFLFVVLCMVGSAFMFIYILFALTIDAIGKKNLLIYWLIIGAICCIFIHWTTTLALSVVLLTLIMSIGNCGGIVSTISMEFFPTNINAMGICFIMMVGRLGAVAGSNIVGQTIFNHCDNVFWAYVGIIVVMIGLSFFLPNRSIEMKNRDKEKAVSA